MDEMEQKLIERIRESDEARNIVEEFIFGDRRSRRDPQGPSCAQATLP
jgi:hypothetical protein